MSDIDERLIIPPARPENSQGSALGAPDVSLPRFGRDSPESTLALGLEVDVLVLSHGLRFLFPKGRNTRRLPSSLITEHIF